MASEDLDLENEIDNLTHLGLRLINAILSKDSMGNIRSLIGAGAPLWYQDDWEGTSALHAAAYTENEELVKLLIEKGAIWNASKCVSFVESSPSDESQCLCSLFSGQTSEHGSRHRAITEQRNMLHSHTRRGDSLRCLFKTFGHPSERLSNVNAKRMQNSSRPCCQERHQRPGRVPPWFFGRRTIPLQDRQRPSCHPACDLRTTRPVKRSAW
jgi:hypothetical protein